MPRWGYDIRKLAIEHWIKADKSATTARRTLRLQLQIPVNQIPCARLISYWGNKCWQEKSVVNGNLPGVRKSKIRPVTTIAAAAVLRQVAAQKLLNKERSSTRTLTAACQSEGVEICRTSVRKLLKEMKMKPYKVRKSQFLKPIDYVTRTRRCEEFLAVGYANEHDLLPCVIFSDEANFSLDGCVSNKNVYWWTDDRDSIPTDMRVAQKEVYSNKITVWAAVNFNFGILGPYVFNGRVDQQNYLHCVIDWFVPLMQERHLDSHSFIFQQDGARCHTTDHVLHQLNEHFEQVIGNRATLNECPTWPQRSPDLSPLDFWLWGRLLPLVYPLDRPKPHDLVELRQNIDNAFNAIALEEVKRALLSWKGRLQSCINAGGRQFEFLM